MSTPLTPQAPLTPEEQQTVARLLSDPFYFPLQFKTWLQFLIENGEGGIAGGGSGGGGGGGSGVPVGAIYFWTTPTNPDGTLWCNGAAISRVGYNALFQKIGTRYGVGDGSTTFNVPDIEGRMIVGQAQSGGHADVSTLGATEGVGKTARRPAHKHPTSPHAHTVPGGGSFNVSDAPGSSPDRTWSATGGGTDGRVSSVSSASVPVGPQTGLEPSDTPAYIVLPAVIRYI